MPESNVTLRANWSKVTLEKRMDGEIFSLPYLYDLIKEQAVMDNVASTYVSSNSGINFDKISSTTNGKGVYTRAGTENDKNPVYYYRGDVNNNNVKFANYCWKIVRTTSAGGIKMIYNGLPDENGYCDNTGDDTTIGMSQFNNYTHILGVQYMRGKDYYMDSIDMNYNTTGSWSLAKDIGYQEALGQYSLIEITATGLANWSSNGQYIAKQGSRYTCFSYNSLCSPVYYITYVDGGVVNYIALFDGETVDIAFDNLTSKSTNISNSDIKTQIDTWYQNNMLDYQDYLEDTPWCNDRSVYDKGYWDRSFTGDGMGFVLFTSMYNYYYADKAEPRIECPQFDDGFTISPNKGNGALTYLVGLLTVDEINLAGGSTQSNSSYYLYTGKSYWTMSPESVNSATARVYSVETDGRFSGTAAKITNGIRPSISLTGNELVIAGNGTSQEPYEVTIS